MVGARLRSVTGEAAAHRLLREARRQRRLTIDEIAAELRIPPGQLTSLEVGDLSAFPAEVYARGAYQQYARYLGVDGQETYRAFLRSLSGARERVPLSVPLPAKWLARVLTPYGVLLALLALGVVLVGSYLGWQVLSFVRLPALAVVAPAESVVHGRLLTVSGEAEAGADVLVNGARALPDAEGQFSLNVLLRPGINVIQVEAVGASGRRRVVVRDVLVPREGSR